MHPLALSRGGKAHELLGIPFCHYGGCCQRHVGPCGCRHRRPRQPRPAANELWIGSVMAAGMGAAGCCRRASRPAGPPCPNVCHGGSSPAAWCGSSADAASRAGGPRTRCAWQISPGRSCLADLAWQISHGQISPGRSRLADSRLAAPRLANLAWQLSPGRPSSWWAPPADACPAAPAP